MEVSRSASLPPLGSAPLVVVTGGKGGVGKSTLAVALAQALGSAGRRVLLVDLDFGLGNLDVMVGREPSATLEDFVRGAVALEQCLVEIDANVALLPASCGTRAMAAPNAARRESLHAALADIAQHFDIVVGDTAAGIGPDVLEFAAAADYTLVVTTPEPTAQADAYGLLKALDELARERGANVPTPELVVNKVADQSEARRIALHLRAVAERFLGRRPALAGWLPASNEIARSLTARRSFVLDPRAGLCARLVHELAQRTTRIAAPSAAR